MHILVVENDSGTRRELRGMLEQLGHTIATAADGREAMNVARQRTCDLAILASELPFADRLRHGPELARTHQIPSLLLVKSSTSDPVADLSALPVYGCVFHPVRLPALQAALSIAAKRFSETQALSLRVSELEEALETRKLIDRAKGKLMRMGMSEQKAFLSIQARARRTQTSMRRVARAILGD